MKRWTQRELEARGRDVDGTLSVGTGDFRLCDFCGENRVIIGPGSILGAQARLGTLCQIGERCEIGEGFVSGDFLRVGECCRFGPDAHIGFGSQIGTGCSFAGGCVIEADTLLAEDVEITGRCTIYGITEADGRELLHISRIGGRKVYAFRAKNGAERDGLYIGCTGVSPQTIDAFEAYASARAEGKTDQKANRDWIKIVEAARYARAHFAQA